MDVLGLQIGLVINNNDPEKRGRVQVFIPHLTNTLYEGWNKEKKDISFRTLDPSVFTEEIHQRLIDVLPWAEVMMPFFGGGTGAPVSQVEETAEVVTAPTPPNNNKERADKAFGTGFATMAVGGPILYYSEKFTGSNNRDGKWENLVKRDEKGKITVDPPPNSDEIDAPNSDEPSVKPKTQKSDGKDTSHTTKRPIPPNEHYAVNNFPGIDSGAAMGMFSIPNVGSKAYVMFLNNDLRVPIVLGCYQEPSNVASSGILRSTGYGQSDISGEISYPVNNDGASIKSEDKNGNQTILKPDGNWYYPDGNIVPPELVKIEDTLDAFLLPVEEEKTTAEPSQT
jgi:hypothetical protein